MGSCEKAALRARDTACPVPPPTPPPACGGPGLPFQRGSPELSRPLERTWSSRWLPGGGGGVPAALLPTLLLQQRSSCRPWGWQGEDALGFQVLGLSCTASVPPSCHPQSLCPAPDFAPSLVSPTEGKTPGPPLLASACSYLGLARGRQGTRWPPLPGDSPRAGQVSVQLSGESTPA